MSIELYKVLGAHHESMHGGSGVWEPGHWRSVRGPLVACERGLHVVTSAQLPPWLGPTIWHVETDGEMLADGDKWVVRRARITEQVTAWNERTARLFAADCAEHALPLYLRKCPYDTRLRQAIEVARQFANGEATPEEVDTAWVETQTAAQAAAGAAAQAVAWSTAWATARGNAWLTNRQVAEDTDRAVVRDANRDMAWAPAWAVARAAAWAADRDAAWAAAKGSAWAARQAATWAAAEDVAWEGEHEWQARHLAEMLELDGGAR